MRKLYAHNLMIGTVRFYYSFSHVCAFLLILLWHLLIPVFTYLFMYFLSLYIYYLLVYLCISSHICLFAFTWSALYYAK